MSLKDLIAQNKYESDIHLARRLQNEASFYISYDASNLHNSKFKAKVASIYNGDQSKTNRFFTAFSGEMIPSIELCETIYSQLSKVWDSQDPAREYNFKNKDLNSEALEYIGRFNDWWRNDYWMAYQHQFSSFIVVDMAQDQSGKFRPEPYPFILDVDRVLYLDKIGNQVKEIIFEEKGFNEKGEPELYYYYYTDKFYSKYLIEGDREILKFENPHDLGRCPVYKVWNEKINKNNWVSSKSAISPNFLDLLWFNVKTIESRKADMLYLNPTIQSPKLSCGYDSTKSSSAVRFPNSTGKCNGGFLFDKDNNRILDDNNKAVLCPVCGEKQMLSAGAGNLVQIDIDSPAIKEGKVRADSELFRYVTPDISGIKEQYKRIEELKDLITRQCVGSDEQPTKSAINELQQTAVFESKEGVLLRISEGISQVRTLVERDIFALRYGDKFISNKYSQGTKFYLHSVEELLERRKNAKDPIQKAQIDEQIIEVRFRNDQKKIAEAKLYYRLLPYNTLTDEEFIALEIEVKPKDQMLRLRFNDAIELFELEYGPMIDYFAMFSDNIPEIKRVKILRDMLLKIIQNV